MDTHTRLHETISALVDGELAASERELAFAALDMDQGRQAWQAYRLISDVLRSEQGGHALSAQFDARLASRLAAEVVPGGQAVPAQSLPPLSTASVSAAAAESLEAASLVQR